MLVSHLHCWRRSFGKQAVIPDVRCVSQEVEMPDSLADPVPQNTKTNQCSKRVCLIITLQLFHVLMSPTFSSKHPAFTIPTTRTRTCTQIRLLMMMPYLNELRILLSPSNLKAGLITFNETLKYWIEMPKVLQKQCICSPTKLPNNTLQGENIRVWWT